MTSCQHVVVYTTTSTKQQADKLALLIMQSHLAACVSVIPGVQSYYYWQEKLEHANECILMIKTTETAVVDLTAFIQAHHEYTEPEVIALPIQGGSVSYMTWLEHQVKISTK